MSASADRGRAYVDAHAATPIGAGATYRCWHCKDAGFLRYDVLPRDPNFARIIECPYCNTVQLRREARAAKQRGRAA